MARAVKQGAIGEPRLATFLLHIPLLADAAAEVPSWWSDAGQGGGWLGAHATHVIDQVRTTLGEFAGVSAALPLLSSHDWTAEDTYSVHFRLESGCAGTIQSSAGDWGPIQMVARIAGSTGTIWAEGDRVRVADARGTRDLEVPADLVPVPPDPPPADLMVSAYDLLHATGIDFGPYTRLAETFRLLIEGGAAPAEPAPATFVDGVANMDVIDAIRRAAAERRWVEL